MTILLGREEAELLIQQVPNEVINGFRVPRFEETIGINEDRAKIMFMRLQEIFSSQAVSLSGEQALVYRNALEAVINELGVDELHTRTGHDFEEGRNLLSKLDQFVVAQERAN